MKKKWQVILFPNESGEQYNVDDYRGLTPTQKKMYDDRARFRKAKEFDLADRLRATLEAQGVNVIAIDKKRRGPLK